MEKEHREILEKLLKVSEEREGAESLLTEAERKCEDLRKEERALERRLSFYLQGHGDLRQEEEEEEDEGGEEEGEDDAEPAPEDSVEDESTSGRRRPETREEIWRARKKFVLLSLGRAEKPRSMNDIIDEAWNDPVLGPIMKIRVQKKGTRCIQSDFRSILRRMHISKDICMNRKAGQNIALYWLDGQNSEGMERSEPVWSSSEIKIVLALQKMYPADYDKKGVFTLLSGDDPLFHYDSEVFPMPGLEAAGFVKRCKRPGSRALRYQALPVKSGPLAWTPSEEQESMAVEKQMIEKLQETKGA